MRRGLTLLLACSVVSFSFGCQKSSEKLVPISGSVTFNRQPIPQGRIVIWPVDESGRPDSGSIVDGKYSLDAHPGSKRVEIHAERAGQPDSELKMPSRVQYIPAKYNSQSKLTIKISPTKDNHFDFDLAN